MTGDIYCIDTSSFIDLKRFYSIDVFPSVWGKMNALARSGRIIAPVEVLNELSKKDDEIFRWAKRHKNKIFKNLDEDQLQIVQDIIRKFPALIDPARELPDADPYIIAVATYLIKKQEQELFRTHCMVVTQERKEKGKIKIPDVCEHYGIEHVDLLEMFRREGWRF